MKIIACIENIWLKLTRIDNNQEINIHYKVIGKGELIIFHDGNGNSINNWYNLDFTDSL